MEMQPIDLSSSLAKTIRIKTEINDHGYYDEWQHDSSEAQISNGVQQSDENHFSDLGPHLDVQLSQGMPQNGDNPSAVVPTECLQVNSTVLNNSMIPNEILLKDLIQVKVERCYDEIGNDYMSSNIADNVCSHHQQYTDVVEPESNQQWVIGNTSPQIETPLNLSKNGLQCTQYNETNGQHFRVADINQNEPGISYVGIEQNELIANYSTVTNVENNTPILSAMLSNNCRCTTISTEQLHPGYEPFNCGMQMTSVPVEHNEDCSLLGNELCSNEVTLPCREASSGMDTSQCYVSDHPIDMSLTRRMVNDIRSSLSSSPASSSSASTPVSGHSKKRQGDPLIHVPIKLFKTKLTQSTKPTSKSDIFTRTEGDAPTSDQPQPANLTETDSHVEKQSQQEIKKGYDVLGTLGITNSKKRYLITYDEIRRRISKPESMSENGLCTYLKRRRGSLPNDCPKPKPHQRGDLTPFSALCESECQDMVHEFSQCIGKYLNIADMAQGIGSDAKPYAIQSLNTMLDNLQKIGHPESDFQLVTHTFGTQMLESIIKYLISCLEK